MDLYVKCSFCSADIVRRAQGKTKNVRTHFCDLNCKSEYQKLAKPVTREWLEDHYVNQKLDCVQIGRIVSRDPKSVWNWLQDFKIPTRTRGSNWQQLPSGRAPGFKLTDEHKARLKAISKADGRVPYLVDGKHWLKGKRGEEVPSWRGGLTPERQAVYSSQEWIEAVKVVWSRDNATCQHCHKHHNTTENRGTFHVHHIVSFMVRELRCAPSNLVLLCAKCHRFVHGARNKTKKFLGEPQ